ncbi:uncharacterized protein LOC121008072 isoform X2 [Bufo bufo]|uniref:uncharacterized protein LOC121008072 isoform X2 n=1 Tax=Bufo bufo TaxID=8384 RepID=UPI001ABDD5D9|nr:uncharacterized protein LOC121008072 isoform X2 [Bufo bufo]
MSEAAGVCEPAVMEPSQPMDMYVCRHLCEQLLILFQDHECDQCEATDNVVQYSALPLCHGVDVILSHMKYCRAGMSCNIPGCPSARVIVSHWKICRENECPVAFYLSGDCKSKVQLQLQAELKSFSSLKNTCHHLYDRLSLLFREHKCEMCAKTHDKDLRNLPLCLSVDATLSHMKYCRAGMSCQVPGCATSRGIVTHGKVCREKDCRVVWSLSKDRKQNPQKATKPALMHLHKTTAHKSRQMLFRMSHGWSCMRRQGSSGMFSDCDLPHCRSMQTLLKHTESCADIARCKYPLCTFSRILFMHYMICHRHYCNLCWPVRSVIKRLCGAKDPFTGRTSDKFWEGRPFFTPAALNDTRESWLLQIYSWLLTKDQPRIGPPLFQRRNPQKRKLLSRRWKKKPRIACNWMRKRSNRWRHHKAPRLQLRTGGVGPSAVPFPL